MSTPDSPARWARTLWAQVLSWVRSTPAEQDHSPAGASSTRPAYLVPLLAAALVMAVCSLFGHLAGGQLGVVGRHGDNPSYLEAARAIRAGTFHSFTPRHFLGLSYMLVALSAITGMSEQLALYTLSLAGFVASIWVARLLWGELVALTFCVIDYAWLEFSAFGGAEPIFVALVLGALLAARSERHYLAAVLGSVSTTVRPLGVFVGLALVGVALRNRRFWAVLNVALVFMIVLGLYGLTLTANSHGPMANVRFYQERAWLGGWPIALPFEAVVRDYLHGPNVGNVVIRHVKAVFVVAHAAALAGLVASPALRRRAATEPTISIFALSYSLFLALHNSPTWALSVYPRLLVPVIPFFLWLYEFHLPGRKAIFAGVVSVALACGAAVGFGQAMHLVKTWMPGVTIGQ